MAASLLLVSGAVLVASWSPAQAQPQYLTAWLTKYSGRTTLHTRIQSQLGLNCFVCHDANDRRQDPSTCYKIDIKHKLQEGLTIAQALDAADSMDSDGDGVSNGIEITTPRNDGTGAIGYHPGLRGPIGVDPCGSDPARAVTNVLETPPPPPCPADFNGANGATVQDIFDFFNAWFAGNASADINHSGDVSVQDIFDFLNLWFASCP